MIQDIDPAELRRAYRIMRSIRAFEERLHVEVATGEVPGFVHLYAGQEAIATGVCVHLESNDYIVSTHRGHGHAIAKGCDIKAMMAEIFGRRDGICGGKGGSMHIADLDKGMLGANGIVGGGPPLAIGAALSARVRGTAQVAVVFLGDGATNQGTFAESMNLAAVWKLPTVFIIENNGWAQATSFNYHTPVSDVARRAAGFGLPGAVVDGHDFFAVYGAAWEAVHRARSGGGSSVIECKAARYYGHYEGDAQTYRRPEEVQEIRATRDCLDHFVRCVTAVHAIEPDELQTIDQEVDALIEEAVSEAKASPWPSEADLLTDVYVSY